MLSFLRRETDLTGRVALVTGGARGIGKAVTCSLLEAGCSVVIADRDEVTAATTARELAARGTVRAMRLDVTDLTEFEQLIARVENTMGPVDILVNNAGIMPLGGFLDQTPETDRTQVEVNLFGVIHGMRAVLPGMLERDCGHIVNIASIAGRIPVPHASVYAATKHAVIGLTESVRAEHVQSAVQFSYILPAMVNTELISGAGIPRYPPPLTVEQVAEGVMRALRTGRVDVYLPRFNHLPRVLPVVLPRRVWEPIGRFFKIDSIFRDVDSDARDAYRKRIRR